MHKILMAERSDLYHDARVQKEASSLRTAGYDVTVIGLRAKRVSIDKEFSFNMDTQYVLDRNWKQIRKLHLAILVLYLNIKILFMRSHYYHAHNTYFLPGMFLAKLLYKGKLVYDSHEVQWELNKTAMLLERIFISKVDKIINVSDGRARAQAHRFGLPLEKICIVSNYPVLENKIINLKTEKNDKNVRFIFSGGLNLSDNKIDNFIRAIKDYPEISLDLLAFGYSNSVPKLRTSLLNLVLEKGLGSFLL